jgi:hypothetical protein
MSLSPLAPHPNIAFTSSAPRVTPTPPRAARFGDVLSSTVMRSAESALQTIPGAPAMAFALRGGIAPRQASSALTSVPSQGVLPSGSPTSTAAGPAPNSSPGVGGEPSAITSSLQQSQDMNLYYLQIQESVNAQNRTFTALSNVMKAEHDTVKTAISNLR